MKKRYQFDRIFLHKDKKLSREPVCKNLDEIEKSCPNLDGMLEGTVKYNISSTIVNCSNNDFEILREGPISKNDILKTLNN